MRIYDITTPMHNSLAGWPGDVAYKLSWSWRKRDGASVNVGRIDLSVHSGTHFDAPLHFDDAGASVDAIDLGVLVGLARVIVLTGCERIRCEDLEPFDLSNSPRVLLRTDTWVERTRFPSSIPVMDEDVPEWLHRQGIILVGLDVPSVDHLDSKTLPNHHALAARGITILESLDLCGVPEGPYELIALPMKLVAADAAPVRAILRELPSGV